MVRRLAREAVIFMLVGMTLAAVGGFVNVFCGQAQSIKSQRDALKTPCEHLPRPVRPDVDPPEGYDYFGSALDAPMVTRAECNLVVGTNVPSLPTPTSYAPDFYNRQAAALAEGTERGNAQAAAQHKNASETEQQPENQAQSPSGTSTVQQNQNEAISQNSNTAQSDKDTQVQRHLQVFTALLVLVGFIQAIIFVWQVVVYLRTLHAMQDANRINRESLQIGQRAYISFPMAAEAIGVASAETGVLVLWRFNLPLENTGNTPAREVRTHVNFHVEDPAAPLATDFPFPDGGLPDDSSSFLAAKGRIASGVLNIQQQTIQRILERQARLFFYGWTTYRDVFEGTALHRTEFCHEMEILAIIGADLRWFIKTYGNHNSQT
jgi:hypothetical protein